MNGYPELAKISILTVLAFAFALLNTPLLTTFLYRKKLGKNIRNDKDTPLFSQMHAKKQGTPTMGGILVWGTVVFLISFFGSRTGFWALNSCLF